MKLLAAGKVQLVLDRFGQSRNAGVGIILLMKKTRIGVNRIRPSSFFVT